MHFGDHDLHCASVLYDDGALSQITGEQADIVVEAPKQGPSVAVYLGQVSRVP